MAIGGGVWTLLDDGGLGRGEGKIGLKWSRGVENGIIVEVKGVNVVGDLGVGVAGSHRVRGMQLGGRMQRVIPDAQVAVRIVRDREVRGGLDLRGEVGGSFARLSITAGPSANLLPVRIFRGGGGDFTLVSSMLVFRTRRCT